MTRELFVYLSQANIQIHTLRQCNVPHQVVDLHFLMLRKFILGRTLIWNGPVLKDTCYVWGKKQQNLQLLDVLACNSANKSACPILKRWYNNRITELLTKISRSAVFASCIACILKRKATIMLFLPVYFCFMSESLNGSQQFDVIIGRSFLCLILCTYAKTLKLPGSEKVKWKWVSTVEIYHMRHICSLVLASVPLYNLSISNITW